MGFPQFPYPDGLVRGTTYYWRIDEVNEAHPDSPRKGSIWSFAIPSQKAYNPIPADGAELVEPDVQLTWRAGLNAALHTVYFGDDFASVNDALWRIPQTDTTYAPAPLEFGKTYYWRVDEYEGRRGGGTTYKGDIWSFTTRE